MLEHRARNIEDALSRLRELAATLAQQPVESFCDTLIGELAAHPGDDVCLLALRTPARAGLTGWSLLG